MFAEVAELLRLIQDRFIAMLVISPVGTRK